MKYCYIDYPYFVPLKYYEDAINRMIEKISKKNGVLSIYQIGSISNPGISDIDILVVFEDNYKCSLNPLSDLKILDRYLFVHDLYGVPKKYFQAAREYSPLYNWKLIWGETLQESQNNIPEEDIIRLKIQTSLEYLIKMYITTAIERTYRILKVRHLLLHVKALKYDLENLNITSGKLKEMVDLLISWRNNWFSFEPTREVLSKWFESFYKEIHKFLNTISQKWIFYLPQNTNLNIGKNIKLIPTRHFYYKHKGIILPPNLGYINKKYINLQHRFNRFNFLLPIRFSNLPEVIEKRFLIYNELKKVNEKKYNFFMPPISPLNII